MNRQPYEEQTEHEAPPPSPSLAPHLPDDSKAQWQGWAEIESDPAFFNVMLREMGVRGVSVREIFSLDSEMLAFLPRPVYGVIFLFRWKEDEEFVDTRYKAGTKVWFANQTVSNACASYAMVNIVNNIPNLELGPHLDHFREFTKDFTPALRGDALANFDFVKQIHNSFTRKMDRLNGDLHMKNQLDDSGKTGRKRKAVDDTEDAAHHFIAFMPIDGVLWKMDGLEWQPRSLGKVRSDDWLDQVKASIESRMSRYSDDEIDFAILGIVQDPLQSRIADLAVNINALQQITSRLHDMGVTGKGTQQDQDTLDGPDASLGITPDVLQKAELMPTLKDLLASGLVDDLKQEEEALASAQTGLRQAVRDEQHLHDDDSTKARNRRHDYGDAIHHWIKFLVHKEAIRGLINPCPE